MKRRNWNICHRLLVFLLFLFLLVPSASMAETDVTDLVELKQTKLVYLKKDQTSFTVASVKNISDSDILSPIRVVIDSISMPDVSVANPDGYTVEGKPYLEFIPKKDLLLSGKITFQKKLYFDNPNNINFSYTTVILSPPFAEIINGIVVPPAPDEQLNNETIKGIDSNSNGIRDDVERMLAKDFGSDPVLYEEIKEHALTLQEALTNPTTETVSNHLDSFRCIMDNEKLDEFIKSTTATINTPLRSGTYGDVFAGAVISKEGCQ